ncbi:MAG: hypothetical protein ACOCWA_10325 [Bacteroidota bacterium]
MAELILNARTGFLVNSIDEAVERIKDIPGIDRKFCHQWAEEKFSRERMTEVYIKVCKKILGG